MLVIFCLNIVIIDKITINETVKHIVGFKNKFKNIPIAPLNSTSNEFKIINLKEISIHFV